MSLNGKTQDVALKYMIEDTRIQIFLPEKLKANGGVLKLKIDFSFVSPEYGSDRMGVLETKNGKIFTMAQWYPRMSVYDEVSGWNTIPYTGPSEFYLEYGDFVHSFGDVHLYNNHMEQATLQLSRTPFPLPTMKINPEVKDIFSFKFEDFTLENYECHPGIKAPVAV